jgi:hypothetical protein
MKIKIMLMALLFPLGALADYDNKNINDACDYLKDMGFNTRSYIKLYDNGYQCVTNYIEIGSQDGYTMANNIAYYVSGDQDSVNELKLVTNVNQKDKASEAINAILAASKTLTKKALGINLPENISRAILNSNNTTFKHGDVSLQVLAIDWPTGKGFEIKYIIK